METNMMTNENSPKISGTESSNELNENILQNQT